MSELATILGAALSGMGAACAVLYRALQTCRAEQRAELEQCYQTQIRLLGRIQEIRSKVHAATGEDMTHPGMPEPSTPAEVVRAADAATVRLDSDVEHLLRSYLRET